MEEELLKEIEILKGKVAEISSNLDSLQKSNKENSETIIEYLKDMFDLVILINQKLT